MPKISAPAVTPRWSLIWTDKRAFIWSRTILALERQQTTQEIRCSGSEVSIVHRGQAGWEEETGFNFTRRHQVGWELERN